ncbi:hypothetical protein B0H13DRAFT_1893921 [Mycena leptocephala]|nr:hypothetical protein B0H13DRAFT_1893921 [Mycena leptocephala]
MCGEAKDRQIYDGWVGWVSAPYAERDIARSDNEFAGEQEEGSPNNIGGIPNPDSDQRNKRRTQANVYVTQWSAGDQSKRAVKDEQFPKPSIYVVFGWRFETTIPFIGQSSLESANEVEVKRDSQKELQLLSGTDYNKSAPLRRASMARSSARHVQQSNRCLGLIGLTVIGNSADDANISTTQGT